MAKETKGKEAPQTAAAAYDWSQTGVTGLENVSREDLGVPFLGIVQKGSPEFDKTHKNYPDKKIVGCDVGDIFNTATREVLYKAGSNEPLIVVPCGFEKMFNEWKPRDKGGGMVKVHTNANILTECTRNEKGQDVLRSGNLIVTTGYFYCLILPDRAPVMIGFTSTQLKKVRTWLGIIMAQKRNGRPMPMFAHSYAITTKPESNDKGSWYGWNIEKLEELTDPNVITDAIQASKNANAAKHTALPPAGGDSDLPM